MNGQKRREKIAQQDKKTKDLVECKKTRNQGRKDIYEFYTAEETFATFELVYFFHVPIDKRE